MTTVLPPLLEAEVQEVVAPYPKVTGGVLTAPLGTTLPTDATSALDPAFITLGRVSVEGVDRTEERPNTEVNDWGGDLIAILQDKYGLTIKFKLMQMMNADVQRAAHGAANVTVTPPTSTSGTLISAKLNRELLPYQSWVIDAYYLQMNMRLVIPTGRITLVGPLKWVHKELAMFDLTLRPFPDGYNNHAYEYWDDGQPL
ncbi:MAG TPA: hypothetical protein VMS84_07570 [Mycobacterium sp.]|jgi:hypothetical protein|nr:hypothetical protein [Mycobacterium sp.]